MNGPIARRRAFGAATVAFAAFVTGCQTYNGPSPVPTPNEALAGSASQIPAEVVPLAIDPLAPNWRIQHSDLGDGRYLFALQRKRFTSGGDGEAAQVFRRRVEELAREQGYAGYEILAFTEGVDSSFPIVAQRVSHGIVQFVKSR